jgi:hypothetical protein
MWKKPYSRDAYTTTYSEWKMVNGRRVGTNRTTTVEPDNMRGAGPTWEND